MAHIREENGTYICPLKPDLDAELSDLASSIKVLAERVEGLISLNRDVIKWLLIVVCLIALGRSALDITKEIVGKNGNGVVSALSH